MASSWRPVPIQLCRAPCGVRGCVHDARVKRCFVKDERELARSSIWNANLPCRLFCGVVITGDFLRFAPFRGVSFVINTPGVSRAVCQEWKLAGIITPVPAKLARLSTFKWQEQRRTTGGISRISVSMRRSNSTSTSTSTRGEMSCREVFFFLREIEATLAILN